MMLKSFILPFRNLFRNKRRTLATGTAILAGFVGLSLLGGYIFRIEKTLRYNTIYLQNKGHLSIFKKDGLQKFSSRPSRYMISKEQADQLQQILSQFASGDIEWIGQTLSGTGLMSNGERSVPFMALGLDSQSMIKSRVHPQVITWAKDLMTVDGDAFVEQIQKNPAAISATKRMIEVIHKPGDVIPPAQDPAANPLSREAISVQLAGKTVYRDLNAVDAEIVTSHTTGYQLSDDSSLLTGLGLLQELYATDGIQSLAVFLKHDRDIEKVYVQIQERLQKEQLPFEVYRFDHPDIAPSYVGTMGFLYVMSGFFIFLISAAVVLSILNSLTMNILERLREIGTLRALGYSQNKICWMMTQESMCLTVICQFVGAVLTILISVIVNRMNIRFNPPGLSKDIQFDLSPNLFIFISLFCFLFIVISGFSFWMTRFQSRQHITDLLTSTGA